MKPTKIRWNWEKFGADRKSFEWCAKLIEKTGKGSIMRLGERAEQKYKWWVQLFGSDIALGSGYPKGRIIEIYGSESSGKTTVALHAAAQAQKVELTAFIDAEHALDPLCSSSE